MFLQISPWLNQLIYKKLCQFTMACQHLHKSLKNLPWLINFCTKLRKFNMAYQFPYDSLALQMQTQNAGGTIIFIFTSDKDIKRPKSCAKLPWLINFYIKALQIYHGSSNFVQKLCKFTMAYQLSYNSSANPNPVCR
jgi:hypothetical protein